ncbi:hypothetical protein MTO96_040492 [Rhipicephalus appendiculatus]
MHLKGILHHNSSSHHLLDSSNRFLLEDMWVHQCQPGLALPRLLGCLASHHRGPTVSLDTLKHQLRRACHTVSPFRRAPPPPGHRDHHNQALPSRACPRAPPPQPGQPQPPYGGAPPVSQAYPGYPPHAAPLLPSWTLPLKSQPDSKQCRQPLCQGRLPPHFLSPTSTSSLSPGVPVTRSRVTATVFHLALSVSSC